ncbi:MAG: hypothetical protein WCG13_07745 [Burkholderiales bacterium]
MTINAIGTPRVLPPAAEEAPPRVADPAQEQAAEQAAQVLLAQAGRGAAVSAPASASRELGALGQFRFQSYLGFRGEDRDYQVKLGYTDNGYSAVQTQTATYAVPASAATNRESIRQWVAQAHGAGAISGVWPLSTGEARAAAVKPTDPVDIGDVLGAAAPDALVYTLGGLNQAHRRDFALVNPLTGSATHFISHKGDTVKWGPLTFNRVETVQYSLSGQGVRREDGLTWASKLKDLGVPGQAGAATLFLNVRGGDTNLRQAANGLSVNAGFFGPPSAMKGAAEVMQRSGNPTVRRAGEAFEKGLQLASVGGSEYGLAWRGTATLDPRSGEVVLNLSGLKIPLHDFTAALAAGSAYNEGDRAIARSINREDYLSGANPYDLAIQSRDPAGRYRNHGDPVSAIAGGIQQLNAALEPGARPVRTNADARRVLEAALQRPPLSPEERQALSSTLELLNRYGMDFGSETIHRAAAASGARVGMPADRQFVRDVFEGDFRTEHMAPRSNIVGELIFGPDRHAALEDLLGTGFGVALFGLNRHVAIAASILDAGGVARDDLYLQQIRAAQEGLAARLDNAHGGVLKALGIEASGLTIAERGSLSSAALGILSGELTERVLRQGGSGVPGGQALYNAFTGLGAAEKAALGARVNALLLR